MRFNDGGEGKFPANAGLAAKAADEYGGDEAAHTMAVTTHDYEPSGWARLLCCHHSVRPDDGLQQACNRLGIRCCWTACMRAAAARQRQAERRVSVAA